MFESKILADSIIDAGQEESPVDDGAETIDGPTENEDLADGLTDEVLPPETGQEEHPPDNDEIPETLAAESEPVKPEDDASANTEDNGSNEVELPPIEPDADDTADVAAGETIVDDSAV